MSKCKNCGADLPEAKENRRPREYCDNKGKCRNEFHRKEVKTKKELSKAAEIQAEFDNYKKETEEKLLKLTMSRGNGVNIEDDTKGDQSTQKRGEGLKEAKNNNKWNVVALSPEEIDKMYSEKPIHEEKLEVARNVLFVSATPPMPKKEDFKEHMDYSIAKSQWKAKYSK